MIGQITGVTRDIRTNKYLVTFATSDLSDLEAYDGVDVDINIKKHRKKRSLNANNYFWNLCTKLANKLGSTKEEIYELYLQENGNIIEDNIIAIPEDSNITSYQGHWLYLDTVDGWSTYVELKGSSDFDTKEMSELIDRVVDGCKEQGIEVLPPDEIERLKKLWKA